MHFFRYKGNELYAEEVPVRELAEKYGTPLYIYSQKTLVRHFKAYDEAYKGFPHIVCYAMKANSERGCIRLANNGCGADIVSGGSVQGHEGGNTGWEDCLRRRRQDRGRDQERS
jgi:diaminopimelate decarboxylase